jgi:hypothetical protein
MFLPGAGCFLAAVSQQYAATMLPNQTARSKNAANFNARSIDAADLTAP